MSIDSSVNTFRDRTSFSTTARRAETARQVTIPGANVRVTRTQAAIGGLVLLAVLVLVARGGGSRRRRGFEITDIGG